MQQKEFEVTTRQVIPPAGVNSLIIENTVISSINFHGIRFSGRLQMDFSEPSAQLASGFITLMCIPNDQIAIPNLQVEADLNDSNSFIIAIEQYQMSTRATSQPSAATTYDFNFAPKTSRICMQGGKIVGQVSNTSPTADVTISTLLSSFEVFK